MNNIVLKNYFDSKSLKGKDWIGIVVAVNDPKKDFRVKVQIDNLTDKIDKKFLPWYVVPHQAGDMGNAQGKKPPVNSRVIVSFYTDDIYNGYVKEVIPSIVPVKA